VSHAGPSGQPGPDYQKLWTQLKEKVITGADAVTEAAVKVTDGDKKALLIGFGLAMTAIQRAMEDGEQLGSIDDALNGPTIG
jgi:hypothetical protein